MYRYPTTMSFANWRAAERNRKHRELFDAQRDELVGRIEKQLRRRHTLNPVFTLRWRLV